MKLRSIQVLRGVAASGVVVLHATIADPSMSPARIGGFGVDLFFVISGFIMATIGSRQSPARFITDRAWRILPMYWIASLPFLIMRWPGLLPALASLALWPVYGGTFHYPALGVGWTLGYEMLFYLAFAIALTGRLWMPLALFGACAAGLAFSPHNAVLEYLGSGLIAEFLLGVLIARLPRNAWLALPLALLALLWLSLAPTDYEILSFGRLTWVRFVLWGLPAALIVYAALSAERMFKHRAFNVAVIVGDASYSIYLFHPLVTRAGNWVVLTIVSLMIGIAAWWLIERRILAIRADLRRLRQGRAPPESKPAPAAGM